MATAGRRSGGDASVKDSMKWTLEYVPETKKYKCGSCGQVLTANPFHDDLKTHFPSCNKSKATGDVMKEIKTELPVLRIKTEVKEENELNVTDIDKKILDLKSDIKKDLYSELNQVKKTNDAAISILLNKIKFLEEKVREMGVDQERRTAKVKAKEARAWSDGIVAQEAIWIQLKKREREIQSAKTGLENEVQQLKTRTENLSEKVETNDQECRQFKRKMEDEAPKHSVQKKNSFHVEPSAFHHFTIPMNCFNLVTRNYLFQPSFRWTINGIKAITARKTFELTSEWFQWIGYPVQARAKLQLKHDDYFYMSLCLKEESESEEWKLIPQTYYLLKDIHLRSSKHMCVNMGYLFSSPSIFSLEYEIQLCHKSWCKLPGYRVNDAIEIEIYVEPSPMTQPVHSYDGTLEWNLENYARRFQLEKEWLVANQESPYFYTGPSGYRVQVRLYLNGATGPTARIMFRTGEFDDKLPESFPHFTTVTLINRKNPERSIRKTIVEDIKSQKYYDFELCEFEEMKNLIDNDTLFCKVVIKAQ